MSDPSELHRHRERMQRDWEQRAIQDAERYVYTRDLKTDEADLDTSGRVNFEQLVRPFLPVLLRGRPPQGCRVLEIGCGLGRMTRWLAESFLEVQGVDISPHMVNLAKQRLANYSNVFLHANSGTDLAGLASNHFDLVFSYLVFQHIPSRAVIANYLCEAARVLQPGGAILFQVSGEWNSVNPPCEPDTWVGERFSLADVVNLLERSGLQPITATGAGTQYLLLAARKPDSAAATLTSFLLPGIASSPEQLLEGWENAAVHGYRPIRPRSRTLLGVPKGTECRLFLSLYFPPTDPFPGSTFAVLVNGGLLGSVSVNCAGDHSYEWTLPSEVATNPRAVVTIEFHGGENRGLPWVRSLGILALNASGLDTAVQRWELEERLAWSRELEAHLTMLQDQLETYRRELGRPPNAAED